MAEQEQVMTNQSSLVAADADQQSSPETSDGVERAAESKEVTTSSTTTTATTSSATTSTAPSAPPANQRSFKSLNARVPESLQTWTIDIPDVMTEEDDGVGEKRGHRWHVWRSYDDFRELHESRVLEAFGADRAPPFPSPPSFFARLFASATTATERIVERQFLLERYLRALLVDPRYVRVRKSVHRFLRENARDRALSADAIAAFVDARSAARPTSPPPPPPPDSTLPDTTPLNLLLPPPPARLRIPRSWELSMADIDAARRHVYPHLLLSALADALEFLAALQHRLLATHHAADKLALLLDAETRIVATQSTLLATFATLSDLLRDPLLHETDALFCAYLRACVERIDDALDWHREMPAFVRDLNELSQQEAIEEKALASDAPSGGGDKRGDGDGDGGDDAGADAAAAVAALRDALHGAASLAERVRTLEQRADELAIQVVAADAHTPLCRDRVVERDDRLQIEGDLNQVAKWEREAHALRGDAARLLVEWRQEAERRAAASGDCGDAAPSREQRRRRRSLLDGEIELIGSSDDDDGDDDADGGGAAADIDVRLEEVIEQCNDLMRMLRDARSHGSLRLPEERIREFEQRLFEILKSTQAIDDASAIPPPPVSFAGNRDEHEATRHLVGSSVALASDAATAATSAEATTTTTASPRAPLHASASSSALMASEEEAAAAAAGSSVVLWPSPVSTAHIRDVKRAIDELMRELRTFHRLLVRHLADEDSRIHMAEYRRRQRQKQRSRRSSDAANAAAAAADDDQTASATTPATTATTTTAISQDDAKLRHHLLDRLEDLQENLSELEYSFRRRFSEHLAPPSRSLFSSLLTNEVQTATKRHEEKEKEMFGL